MAGPKTHTAADDTPPVPIERLTGPFVRFTRLNSAGGILLIACTLVAMFWANSAAHDSYHHLFHVEKLKIGFGKLLFEYSLGHWINDALMALFFFVVGLEIKREVLVGELASPRKAALPIAAALGGMIGPALIYAALNAVKPHIPASAVDKVTEETTRRIGFGPYMLHRTGHSLGLDVHELPSVAVGDETILLPGMIITIEPGVYDFSIGAWRIEDTVLVTDTVYELLTNSPRQLMVL